jgi:glycerol kinase
VPADAAGGAILALDQGTTSSRALLIDGSGRILASARHELTSRYPEPGWVEQDADEIWGTQLAAAREALALGGQSATKLAAVAITNQRETTVVWERASGRPIAPAIVWQDRRTAPACEQLRRDGCEPLVRQKTGLLLDPYFSATKVRWILDAVPGARERAARGELVFGTVDSWLVWRLTGGRRHVTDATNASRTLLYDLRSGDWDDELLALFGIPRAMLPDVCDSSGVVAVTDADLLGAAVPIAGIAGDQQAALYGQACTRPGMAKVTYGTGCFLLLHTGTTAPPPPPGLLTTVAVQREGRRVYALEGSVFVGGAVIQWLRDELGLAPTAAAVAALADEAPSTGGVCFVPTLTGAGAPHWDPQTRGAILGITRGTTAAQIARAALEGVAFQVADLVQAMAEGPDTCVPIEVRADGGAGASDLLLQTQADLLNVPVVRSAQAEATAFGAACLAGLATGVWDDEAHAHASWQAARTFLPVAGDRERMLAGWRKALACVRAFGSGTESPLGDE